ncbi:MAG: sigma-54-dependent transcriptional regulator [Planctomycetaceae bacterium]
MHTVLLVDDEPNVQYSVSRGLQTEALKVLTAATGCEAIDCIGAERPDVVVLDVRLPDMSGLEALDRIRTLDPHLPVIVVTAYASTETAIEAMKRGAFDYLLKPVPLEALRALVHRAIELHRMRSVPAIFGEADEPVQGDRMVGNSEAMQAVYKAIGRVAPQDVSVMILGESGTGKELVARAIFQHSPRAAGPFVAINCAAIAETLLESELFGHERGAFTGADRLRIGKFEQAHRGTLFLDELGDMSLGTQAKLLRVLQERSFERLGGAETIHSDVRVIAASNQDLEKLVDAGRFRRDLYFRLNDFTIRLPPLRERPDDLPLLVEHFLRVYNAALSKSVAAVSPEAMQRLQNHHWPGNVRELQGVIKHALLHCTGSILAEDGFPLSIIGGAESSSPADEVFDLRQHVRNLLQSGVQDVYWKSLADFDRIVLSESLNHLQGNQAQVSELLGMSRTTLRNKLSSLGLLVSKQVVADSGRSG